MSIIPYFLVVAVAIWIFITIQKRKRSKTITELTNGTNVLAHWTYSPAEWLRAVEDEFDWAAGCGYTGETFISPTAVYIRTDRRDLMINLADKGKVLTHASYRGAAESPLKLRVRWKVVTRSGHGSSQTKYYKEDYRIPVPPGAKALAVKVVDFFTLQIENNPEAYANVVDDDEPISLFGRDDSL